MLNLDELEKKVGEINVTPKDEEKFTSHIKEFIKSLMKEGKLNKEFFDREYTNVGD